MAIQQESVVLISTCTYLGHSSMSSLRAKRLFGLSLSVGVILLLFACSPGKASFRVVQLDLANKQSLALFVEEMKAISKEEQMEYVDGSKETERGLDTIDYSDQGRADGSPTIHLAVQRSDGMGVTAINVSLPGYRVALGFTDGSNAIEARRFADKVIARLEQHWTVEEIRSMPQEK
jgi:hypothetical protein